MDLPTTTPEAAVDLTDPRTHADRDLDGFWRQARRRHPVWWHPPSAGADGFWVLSRHADIVEVYRDPRRFTSIRGNVLDVLSRGGDPASGLMLPVSDGPRHKAIRRVVARGLTPAALESAAASIASAVRALVAEALDKQTCDFVADVAARVPLAAICDLLAIPDADRGFILGLTSSALSSEHPDRDSDDVRDTRAEILLYFANAIGLRRRSPGDDLISLLATMTVDDQPLTDAEVVMNCYSLVLGGDETARLALSGTVDALIRHPDQWQRLRTGGVDTETAVEELLRWTTPAMHVGRTATETVELQGTRIASGDTVTLWNNSANRDETVFDRPDEFDLGRTPNRHLTFGYGTHYCVGAHLARVELSTLLDTLAATVSSLTAAAPAARTYSNFLTGFSSLPIVLS